MDLAPAHTTSAGVRASSTRSADSSNGASRCTPPMPPVAKTGIPATPHSASAPATVVAPSTASATAIPRSRAEHLRTPEPARKRGTASSGIPSEGTPATTAVMAGTAPPPSTAATMRRAASALNGGRSPCASTELSSATTGAPPASAAATSGVACTSDGSSVRRMVRSPWR